MNETAEPRATVPMRMEYSVAAIPRVSLQRRRNTETPAEMLGNDIAGERKHGAADPSRNAPLTGPVSTRIVVRISHALVDSALMHLDDARACDLSQKKS